MMSLTLAPLLCIHRCRLSVFALDSWMLLVAAAAASAQLLQTRATQSTAPARWL